jgi:hypothetical protein
MAASQSVLNPLLALVPFGIFVVPDLFLSEKAHLSHPLESSSRPARATDRTQDLTLGAFIIKLGFLSNSKPGGGVWQL